MANKKITQLTRIGSGSLSSNDLFVVVDVDAPTTPTGENKGLLVEEFVGFLSNSNLLETSSYSLTSGTASYALSSGDTNFISSHITLSVTSSGNDITGNIDSPFATLQGAMGWLSYKRIVSGGLATISVGAENYINSSPIELSHPDGQYISIVGNNNTSLTNDPAATISTMTFISQGIVSASFAVTNDFASKADIDNYVMIVDTAQNTFDSSGDPAKNRGLCGIWRIISKTPTSVTVLIEKQVDVSDNMTFVPGVNTFDMYLIKTTFQFINCNGLIVNGSSIGSIQNLAVIGFPQNQNAGFGGNGISVGRSRVRFNERFDTDDHLSQRKGSASATCKLVGVRGFAWSGFSSNNGSISCINCVSSFNGQNGFSAENGSRIDANHAVASGNEYAGFYADSNSSIECRFSNSSWNRWYGYHANNGSSILADSYEKTIKCTFAGFNGAAHVFAKNGSVISIEGLYGVGLNTPLSTWPGITFHTGFLADTNSTINANFSYFVNASTIGFYIFNNSCLNLESAYINISNYAGAVIRGSQASFGNSEFTRDTVNTPTSDPIVTVRDSSTVNCSGLKVFNEGTHNPQHVRSVINISDNSSIQTSTFYVYDVKKAHSSVPQKPLFSLNLKNMDSGSALTCQRRSYGYVQSLTSSVLPNYYDLEARSGGYINVFSPNISTISTYPSASIPFDSDLSVCRNG